MRLINVNTVLLEEGRRAFSRLNILILLLILTFLVCVVGDINVGSGDDQHTAVRTNRHDAVSHHDGDAV